MHADANISGDKTKQNNIKELSLRLPYQRIGHEPEIESLLHYL